MKKLLLLITLGLSFGIPVHAAVTQGFQGGTGLSTSTAGNDGKCLTQSSSSPFLTWSIGTCGGGGGGSGSVSTSSAITINNYPFWVTAGGGLSGTSTLTNTATGIAFTSASGTNLTASGYIQSPLVFDLQGNKFVTSTAVTTSSAGTINAIPIWTSASALGNSSLSQAGGATLINGVTAIFDGGGDYIGPNILMTTANNLILQNPTSSAVLGNAIFNGGVTYYSASTSLSGAQFCAGGFIPVLSTNNTTTLTFPDLNTISASACNQGLYAGGFSLQFARNATGSTTNLTNNTSGTGESIYYAPGTPSYLLPGQEWLAIGQFENTSTIQGATGTGNNLVVKLQLYETSTITSEVISANFQGAYRRLSFSGPLSTSSAANGGLTLNNLFSSSSITATLPIVWTSGTGVISCATCLTVQSTPSSTSWVNTQILFGQLGGTATSSLTLTYSSTTDKFSVTNVSSTNITASGYIQITGNNLFDANGNKYSTSTGGGSGNVITAAASTVTLEFPYFTTTASTTLNPTSTLFSTTPGLSIATSALSNSLFNIVNSSNISTFNVSATTTPSTDYILAVQTSTATSTITTVNTFFGIASSGLPMFLGTSTSITIGGAALSAGACTSTTVVVPIALSTTTFGVDIHPQIYPGAGTDWHGYITATAAGSSTITAEVCEPVIGTPTASKYNIFIKQLTGL